MRARRETKERWRGLRTTRHLGRRILILYAITAAAVAAVFSTALLVNWLGTVALATSDEQGIRTYQNLVTLQAAESDGTSQLITYLTSGETDALRQYRATVTTRQRAYEQLAAGANDSRTEYGDQGATAALGGARCPGRTGDQRACDRRDGHGADLAGHKRGTA